MEKAYILASGEGKRMWPYSDRWQKCCLPVGNISCIERMVVMLKSFGIDEIVVVASTKISQIKYALRRYTSVIIKQEENPSGTAQSLLRFVEDSDEDFLVVYGDVVVDRDSIKKIIDEYRKNGPSIMVKELNREIYSSKYICASVDSEKIKAIYGHPRRHYVTSRVVGVFALNKKVIPYLEANPGYMLNVCVGGMPPEEAMLEQSLQLMIEDGIEFNSVEVEKYFVDLDAPHSLLEANDCIIREQVATMVEDSIDSSAEIHSSAVIEGKIRLGKGSSIGKNVVIKGNLWVGDNTHIDYGAIMAGNNIVGDNCRITDHCMVCSNTVIGNKNKLGFSAQIEGLTFDGVSMVHNCEVFGIVGSNTDIAAGVVMGAMRFDDEYCNQDAGRFGNAVIIGDYVRTGVSNTFYPGVKVGCCTAIYPSTVIDEDIPANTLVVVKQEKILKKWGSERYNW